jgi:adenylate cyclase
MFSQLKKFNLKNRSNNLPEVKIGIGINYGEVISGNIGSTRQMNYTVIGDNVNLASRLCSHAKANQIVISKSAHELLSDKIGFTKKSPIQVKGKKDKIDNWVFEVD